MKVLILILATLSLNSCAIYLKDAIHGDPTKRPVEENYLEAKAEGFTEEEAKRRALLVGNDTDETRAIKKRRRDKEREARRDSDAKWYEPLIFWD